jgi:hypothetical protein
VAAIAGGGAAVAAAIGLAGRWKRAEGGGVFYIFIFFKNIFYRNIFLFHNLQFYTSTARPAALLPGDKDLYIIKI